MEAYLWNGSGLKLPYVSDVELKMDDAWLAPNDEACTAEDSLTRMEKEDCFRDFCF